MNKETKRALLHRNGQPLTMYAVHKGTGISYPHVVRIFNGKRRPSAANLSKIANFLGISMNKLYAAIEGGTLERPVATDEAGPERDVRR